MLDLKGLKDDRLVRLIKRIEAGPQSPEGELNLSYLKWEVERRECENRIKVLDLAAFLLGAYEKTGQMSVMLPDGRQFQDRPEYGGSPVQHVWNASSKAENMARLGVRK